MNKIYLPTLKSVNIKNYTLYPNDLNLTYNFIEGVNLIIGGNGIGKTTFVNIIKYALIGLYRKHKDSRKYKNSKVIKRQQYSEDFFRSRIDKSFPVDINESAEVTIEFSIRDVLFTVTRSLYDIRLDKVTIKENNNEYNIDGHILKQHSYEKLSEKEKIKCLQYKYEEKVAELINVYDFDDFIFLINEILIFGENRKTILWDTELQEILSSKYFNDPILDNAYKEFKMDAKYYDSLSRHKSEDIRAVSLVLENIKEDSQKQLSDNNITKEINNLKLKIEKNFMKLEKFQNERKLMENKLRLKISEKTSKTKEKQEIEQKIKYEEKKLYKDLWEQLNPQYHIFKKYIKDNISCPLCNKEMEENLYLRILQNENKCILCNKEIKQNKKSTGIINDLKISLNEILLSIQNIEREIYSIEISLKELDNDFNKTKINLTNMQSQLRDLEYAFSSEKQDDNYDTITIKKMMDQISLLEKEKKDFQEKSKYYNNEAKKIASRMDADRVAITRELSQIFNEFAGKFLGKKTELTYDNLDGDGNRYIPSIDDSIRLYPDELSESQCFFTDHSFRMSLLKFFYTTPAFFICETPESSLDISYEINAANIFLKYLDNPNSLILTSNINNSEFLDYIIDHANNINYINLLKVGKPTIIQNMSSNLIEISNRIEAKIIAK